NSRPPLQVWAPPLGKALPGGGALLLGLKLPAPGGSADGMLLDTPPPKPGGVGVPPVDGAWSRTRTFRSLAALSAYSSPLVTYQAWIGRVTVFTSRVSLVRSPSGLGLSRLTLSSMAWGSSVKPIWTL